MRAVCVSCGFRENGNRRSCPRCGWLMLEGGLPQPGSVTVPRRPRSLRRIAVVTAMGVLFTGGFGGMAIASLSATDPVAHAKAAAAPIEEAPVAAAPVAESAPAAVASVARSTRPAAKKKPVAKKNKKKARRHKKSRPRQIASRR